MQLYPTYVSNLSLYILDSVSKHELSARNLKRIFRLFFIHILKTISIDKIMYSEE